jgi:hypothetical protein
VVQTRLGGGGLDGGVTAAPDRRPHTVPRRLPPARSARLHQPYAGGPLPTSSRSVWRVAVSSQGVAAHSTPSLSAGLHQRARCVITWCQACLSHDQVLPLSGACGAAGGLCRSLLIVPPLVLG